MQSSTRKHAVGVGLGVALALAAGLLQAQEPTASKTSRAGTPSAKRTVDPARRVPDFFGQIGLTPEQRETIYKIRGKRQAEIDALEEQIVGIQKQMLAECEGVLTDTQRQLLAQRRQASGAGARAEGKERGDKGQSKAGG